jgi:hypothetical protein
MEIPGLRTGNLACGRSPHGFGGFASIFSTSSTAESRIWASA